jgi:hypothetical protein
VFPVRHGQGIQIKNAGAMVGIAQHGGEVQKRQGGLSVDPFNMSKGIG